MLTPWLKSLYTKVSTNRKMGRQGSNLSASKHTRNRPQVRGQRDHFQHQDWIDTHQGRVSRRPLDDPQPHLPIGKGVGDLAIRVGCENQQAGSAVPSRPLSPWRKRIPGCAEPCGENGCIAGQASPAIEPGDMACRPPVEIKDAPENQPASRYPYRIEQGRHHDHHSERNKTMLDPGTAFLAHVLLHMRAAALMPPALHRHLPAPFARTPAARLDRPIFPGAPCRQ